MIAASFEVHAFVDYLGRWSMRIHKAGLGAILAMAMAALVWLAPAASAACHRFTLDVSPTSVSEGDTVTVTVTRDASAADSSVRVAASGQSADPGSDFSALGEQVSFTGSEVEKSVTIDILADDEPESSETFTVGLSDPEGCSVNPNFSLADDVMMTIEASEGAESADEPEPAEEEEQLPGQSEPEPVTDDAEEEEDDEDGWLTPGLIIAAVVVLVAAGGFLAFKKRSTV
ncbi:MAG: hypothetical protein KY393_00550 [Actinobacteria bacterium]|nr:hypothetical protein [Actinomycetota bacterium]